MLLPERGPPGPHHDHERAWRPALRQEMSCGSGETTKLPEIQSSRFHRACLNLHAKLPAHDTDNRGQIVHGRIAVFGKHAV